MSQPDKDVAHLAASTIAALNNSINRHTTTSHKDIEVLNPSRLDIHRFLPKGRHNQAPQQQYGHVPQQQVRRDMPPQGYNQPQPQQQQYPRNDIGRSSEFEPIGLPSEPIGYLPMSETAKQYAESTGLDLSPRPPAQAQPVDISGPSFQDTEFSSPTVDLNGPTPIDNTSQSSLKDMITDQSEMIDSLRKKVTTLTTKLNKVIKLLESSKIEILVEPETEDE